MAIMKIKERRPSTGDTMENDPQPLQMGVENDPATMENSLVIPLQIKHRFTPNPEILLLSMSRAMKTGIHTKTS